MVNRMAKRWMIGTAVVLMDSLPAGLHMECDAMIGKGRWISLPGNLAHGV